MHIAAIATVTTLGSITEALHAGAWTCRWPILCDTTVTHVVQ